MPEHTPALRFAPLIDFAGNLPPSEPYRPLAERILSGDPVQTAHNFYSSADGHFHCGVWTCQPGKWRVVFTEHEFCQILEGVLVVTGDDGASERTFRAGDAFVSPAGFTGIWEVIEPAKKVYAIYE
ncbi:MAG: cupin domain-containing protein [Hyphomicrobiaceae bacterium]|nr:cupin domain-containing protein [Hyphomicrobiaceae bacterium]